MLIFVTDEVCLLLKSSFETFNSCMGSDFNLIKGKHSCTLSPSTGPLCSYFHAISDEFPTVILLIKAKSRLVVFMGLSTKTLTHFGQNLAFS